MDMSLADIVSARHLNIELPLDAESMLEEILCSSMSNYMWHVLWVSASIRVRFSNIDNEPIEYVPTYSPEVISTISRAEILLNRQYISMNLSGTRNDRKILEICKCSKIILQHILLSTEHSSVCESFSVLCMRLNRLSLFGYDGLYQTTCTLPRFNMRMEYSFSATHAHYFEIGEYIPVFDLETHDINIRNNLKNVPKMYKILQKSEHVIHCVLLIEATRNVLHALRGPFTVHSVFEDGSKDIVFSRNPNASIAQKIESTAPLLSHDSICKNLQSESLIPKYLTIVQKNAISKLLDIASTHMLSTLCGAIRTIETNMVHIFSAHGPRTMREISNEKMSCLSEMSGSILALATGMGKTLVTLCTAKMLGGDILIIVPPTLVLHWESEAKKHAFECDVVHRKCDLDRPRDKSICVINRDVLRHLKSEKLFRACFIDEAHTFCSTTVAFKAFSALKKQTVFPITATPSCQFFDLLSMIHPMLSDILRDVSDLRVFLSQYVVRCVHPPMQFTRMETNVQFLNMPENLLQLHRKLDGLTSNSKKRAVLFSLFERSLAGTSMCMEEVEHMIDQCLSSSTDTKFQFLTTAVVQQPFVTGECPVCLDVFTNPVFSHCGHVLCKSCMGIAKTRCPLCRDIYTTPIQVWRLAKSSNNQETAREEPVVLIEKRVALENYLRKHVDRGQLVLFTKRHAQVYADVCNDLGKSVLVASQTIGRAQSCTNIESFRAGKADILVCNYTFAAGFDLFNVEHIVMVDMDTQMANMIQAVGRATRLSQKHPVVFVTTFVFEHSVEHYLYSMRKEFGDKIKFNTRTAFGIESLCTKNIEGSRINRIEKFMETIQNWLNSFSSAKLKHESSPRFGVYKLTYTDDAHGMTHTWFFDLAGEEVTVRSSRSRRKYTKHRLTLLESMENEQAMNLLTR